MAFPTENQNLEIHCMTGARSKRRWLVFESCDVSASVATPSDATEFEVNIAAGGGTNDRCGCRERIDTKTSMRMYLGVGVDVGVGVYVMMQAWKERHIG